MSNYPEYPIIVFVTSGISSVRGSMFKNLCLSSFDTSFENVGS